MYCHNYSKLLIDKEASKHLLNLPPDERWNAVFKIASNAKECGEHSRNGCGYKQPLKVRKEGLATIAVEWKELEGVDPEPNQRS